MSSEFLRISRSQIEYQIRKNKERAPGDEYYRIDYICNQIKDRILAAEIWEETRGATTEGRQKLMEMENVIEGLFKKI